MSAARIRRFAIWMTVAIVAGILEAQTVIPTFISAEPRRVPNPEPRGELWCTAYAQLPMATKLANGEVIVWYDEGRIGVGDHWDCGRQEELIGLRLDNTSRNRVVVHEGAYPYHIGNPDSIYDCAPREFPICGSGTSDSLQPCSLCSDSDPCPSNNPIVCGECWDQYHFDRPPPGYDWDHTTKESAMASVAYVAGAWRILWTRTNWESHRCAWGDNIDPSGQDGCIPRHSAMLAVAHSAFPPPNDPVIYDGDLNHPWCSVRGCCTGSGFHDASVVPIPEDQNRAHVFVLAILDGPRGGFWRFEYEPLVSNELTNGVRIGDLPGPGGMRLTDMAWSWVPVQQETIARYWALTYSGAEKLLYVYYSDDMGITWHPFVEGNQHVHYGDGVRTWLGGWLHNPDGSLASPLTVVWGSNFDHDDDPATKSIEQLYYETEGMHGDLPSFLLDTIHLDGFDRGDLSGWFAVYPTPIPPSD